MAEQDTDFLDELMQDRAADEVEELEEEAPAPEPAQTVEQPEPPAAEVPTTPEPKKEETVVPLPALLAEREKRQNLERRLAELEQQQPKPEFWEAPEAHIQQVVQQTQQRMFAALEEQAKAVYPDYDEVTAKALEAAQANPLLVQQVMSAANPALAMYQLGKATKEAELLRDPAALRAQVEAELRAELEAEYAEKLRTKATAAAAVPPDLSQHRNAAGQFAPAAVNPVDELFPR